MYDKDKIKESLSIEQVFDLVAELGGEPQSFGNFFTAKTICHNGNSHKLYYYENTKLFKCYTDCGTTFDIFELVCKVKNTNEEYKTFTSREGQIELREWSLVDGILFVANYFNISGFSKQENGFFVSLKDWDIFDRYDQHKNPIEKKRIELKTFESNILKYLPQPIISPWEEEGISREVMQDRGIRYDPKNQSIIIPHFDINDNLVGIRQRTLIKAEEKYGKYRPAIFNKQMYNHPLGFNLYNLNNSKENIKLIKKVIVFEGEKSPLLYASYFGIENDISVACCGSSLISYQVQLLLSLGVQEIIIAFDKQFKKIGDEEWKKWTEKLKNFHSKYGSLVQISFIFDKQNLLSYKASPIDHGKEIFMKLFKERINL